MLGIFSFSALPVAPIEKHFLNVSVWKNHYGCLLIIRIPGTTSRDSDSAAALWLGLVIFVGVPKSCGAPEPRRNRGAITWLGAFPEAVFAPQSHF